MMPRKKSRSLHGVHEFVLADRVNDGVQVKMGARVKVRDGRKKINVLRRARANGVNQGIMPLLVCSQSVGKRDEHADIARPITTRGLHEGVASMIIRGARITACVQNRLKRALRGMRESIKQSRFTIFITRFNVRLGGQKTDEAWQVVGCGLHEERGLRWFSQRVSARLRQIVPTLDQKPGAKARGRRRHRGDWLILNEETFVPRAANRRG